MWSPRLLALLAAASALSSYNPAYGTAYSASSELDQAAFTSAAFWAEVARELPGFADDPELERFRGFARNLRTEPPGAQRVLANGQVLLRQYEFPGLQDAARVGERAPFPEIPRAAREALEALAPRPKPRVRPGGCCVVA